MPPKGARLIRIRERLVELCRIHAPDFVAQAEALLERARRPPGTQGELFQ